MKKYLIFFIFAFFLFSYKVLAITKAPLDITKMSIEDLEDALEKGYITSEVLVNLYLERIEKYDDLFNSINQINENAIEEARKLDDERKEGKIRGKLHGIPLLVKCNIDVKGLPTTAGTKALLDNYPINNSFAVQKLIDEGAIILGSTNMSELAFSAGNSYSSYGYVKNVFNTNYTPYGSSGGSAVAVKAAFAAASLGTDTNSSVRLPASGAGLVGVRPTLGLVSRSGVIPYDIERDTIGVLSRTVKDNALLLSIISGTDTNDEKTKNIEVPDLSLKDTSLEGINIGVPVQYVKGSGALTSVTGETDGEIYELLIKSLKELESKGAHLIYLDDFVKSSNISIATSTYAGITMCDNFNKYIKGTSGTIRSFEELATSSGHVQALMGYVPGCGGQYNDSSSRDAKKKKYRDYVDDVFKKYSLDAILYPTVKNKPFSYKSYGSISPGSTLGSVIGYPSITIPMGFDSDGFSYGIEFLSLGYQENKMYNIALEFEKANENVVDTSLLTPSLYEIPSSVETLNSIYEEVLLLKNVDKEIENWLKDVRDFYSSYNEETDVDKVAFKLINKYDETVVTIMNMKKTYSVKIILEFMLFLLLGIAIINLIKVLKFFRY